MPSSKNVQRRTKLVPADNHPIENNEYYDEYVYYPYYPQDTPGGGYQYVQEQPSYVIESDDYYTNAPPTPPTPDTVNYPT
ncbi:unnamed protein product, partial [Didymodactylos carnosus]